MRALGGSRTPTPLRGPGSEPGVSTEVPPRAREWSVGESNPADPACKARLHTSAHPSEPAAGLEPATSALRGRRTTHRAALAYEPAARVEPAAVALQGRRATVARRHGVRGGSRTRTPLTRHRHLKPARLPVPPQGHRAGSGGFGPRSALTTSTASTGSYLRSWWALERLAGFEPAASTMATSRSAN